MRLFKFIGTALWEVFGEDVVKNPRPQAPQMSTKQMYNYLVSQRRLSQDDQVLLEQLAQNLGIEPGNTL